jgi:hypothetical protein
MTNINDYYYTISSSYNSPLVCSTNPQLLLSNRSYKSWTMNVTNRPQMGSNYFKTDTVPPSWDFWY